MALLCLPAPDADLRDDPDLCTRIEAEFREMPGLTLTLPQAARLFSLDLDRCERVLDALVHGGLLRTDGRSFARADVGRRWV
jgi:hypothetical protein